MCAKTFQSGYLQWCNSSDACPGTNHEGCHNLFYWSSFAVISSVSLVLFHFLLYVHSLISLSIWSHLSLACFALDSLILSLTLGPFVSSTVYLYLRTYSQTTCQQTILLCFYFLTSASLYPLYFNLFFQLSHSLFQVLLHFTPAAKCWPSIPDRAAFLTARGMCVNYLQKCTGSYTILW